MRHPILRQSIELDAATRAYYEDKRQTETNTLPSDAALQEARANGIDALPNTGLGFAATIDHLEKAVLLGLNFASLSPNYYGFVTGGSTPIAAVADSVVSAFDNNAQVHLPAESIVTEIEDKALRMLCQLLDLDADVWTHRTFTTGATASNVVGLACGREGVVHAHAECRGTELRGSVSKTGLMAAMREANLDDIQILSTTPHSSLGKAASIVGLGRHSINLVNRSDKPHLIDFAQLEEQLKRPRVGSIVSVSCSEVNTGFFATGKGDMSRLAELCRKYRAWIHVDAAFGLMARMLAPSDGEFQRLLEGCEDLHLAHSIAVDAHKLLNVPYDCGIFFCRIQEVMDVFQNAGAVYLQSGPSDIPSPLNIGIENSRRFRALPVYANLVAYGRDGLRSILQTQIRLARKVARYIRDHPGYELLPEWHQDNVDENTYMIVLFRAKDRRLNAELVSRINRRNRIYLSGTRWDGQPASRIAVSNWQADVDRDSKLIGDVLDEVYRECQRSS